MIKRLKFELEEKSGTIIVRYAQKDRESKSKAKAVLNTTPSNELSESVSRKVLNEHPSSHRNIHPSL